MKIKQLQVREREENEAQIDEEAGHNDDVPAITPVESHEHTTPRSNE